jgi:hypothetical protein
MNSDNIIQIDALRIERNKQRKCTCDPRNKKFTIDTTNREVTCGCGLVVDPFEAMEHLAKYYERINDNHKRLRAQADAWIKEKPYSVLFKRLEVDYQRGKMLPYCPTCKELFDFKDVTSFGNAEFYRKRQRLEKQNDNNP